MEVNEGKYFLKLIRELVIVNIIFLFDFLGLFINYEF